MHDLILLMIEMFRQSDIEFDKKKKEAQAKIKQGVKLTNHRI